MSKGNTLSILKLALLFAAVFSALISNSQAKDSSDSHRHFFPIWSYHQKNINIDGVSIGFWSADVSPDYTNTNGIKIELIGLGFIMPLIPESPVPDSDSSYRKMLEKPNIETVNGLGFSTTGTACQCDINGLSIGGLGQIQRKVNGFTFALFLTLTTRLNGLGVSAYNSVFELNGIQVGIVNKSRNTKGFQFGIWNTNEKRSLPIVNWNFRKDE